MIVSTGPCPAGVTSMTHRRNSLSLCALTLWMVSGLSASAAVAAEAGHTGRVHGVAFSPDSRILATAGADGSVRLWDVTSRSLIATWDQEPATIATLSFSSDGLFLASGREDGALLIRRVPSGEVEHERSLRAPVRCLRYAPDGNGLGVALSDSVVGVLDAATGEDRWSRWAFGGISVLPIQPMILRWYPDGTNLVVAPPFLKRFDASTGERLRGIFPTKGVFPQFDFSPDGSKIAGLRARWRKVSGKRVREPREVAVWGFPSRKLLLSLDSPEPVSMLLFSPDGRTLAGGCTDGTVRFWDSESGDLRRTVRMAGGSAIVGELGIWLNANTIAFSPDGKLFAGGGVDGRVDLFDVDAGTVAALDEGVVDPAKVKVATTDKPDPRMGSLALRVRADVRAGAKLKSLGLAPKMKAAVVYLAAFRDMLEPYAVDGLVWPHYSWKERMHFVESAEIVETNLFREKYAYLMNVEPGRYAAIAVDLREVGVFSHLAALSGRSTALTEVRLSAADGVFIGDLELNLDRMPVDLTQAAVFERLAELRPDLGRGLQRPTLGLPSTITTNNTWFGKQERISPTDAAVADFRGASRKTFEAQPGWRNFFERIHPPSGKRDIGTDGPVAEIDAMVERAGISAMRDRLDQTLERLEEALRRARQIGDEGRTRAAAILMNLGDVHRLWRQDLAQATTAYQSALEIRERALGPNHPAVAFTLMDLGMVARARENYDEAISLLERALAIRESSLGPDHDHVAIADAEIATTYMMKDNPQAARPHVERAIGIMETKYGKKYTGVRGARYMDLLNNRAIILSDLDEYEEAESSLLSLLKAHQMEDGRKSYSVLQTLVNLSGLYATKRDYGKAVPMLEEAIGIAEEIEGENSLFVGSSLHRLAFYYRSQGRSVGDVLDVLDRASRIVDESLVVDLAVGSDADKLETESRASWMLESVVEFNISAAAGDPRAAQIALRTLLRRKGLALDATARNRATFRSNIGEEQARILDELAEARERLASLSRNEDADMADIEAARRRVGELEASLSSQKGNAGSGVGKVTPDAVRDALPRGGALIEITLFRPARFDTAQPAVPVRVSADREERFGTLTQRRWGLTWGPRRYAACVITPGNSPRWIDLGTSERIDELVADLRRAIERPEGQEYRTAARALDEAILEPIRPFLGEARLIFIAPDGAMNLVPFDVLMDAEGHFAIEKYTFDVLTSGRELLSLGKAASGGDRGDWIVANPDFSAGDSVQGGATSEAEPSTVLSRDFRVDSFEPLPGTAVEARTLHAILPSATVVSGAEATEAFLKKLESPRLLHIATHGFFLEDQQLPADGQPTVDSLDPAEEGGAPPDAQPYENPLLRSGIVLAGANGPRKAGEDGILTALEASGLHLRDTRLVVLSACRTGVGEVRNGQGVFGLRRALTLAGAESQIMSLWSVSDISAPDLMAGFYHRLTEGAGRAEALRAAQLEMLSGGQWSHPFFWAAFVHSGAWTPLNLAR